MYKNLHKPTSTYFFKICPEKIIVTYMKDTIKIFFRAKKCPDTWKTGNRWMKNQKLRMGKDDGA